MIGNDHWTLQIEELGMEESGDALARLIATCDPPFVVAVQGKWGSGKTSLMRYAMALLGGEPLAATSRTLQDPVLELPETLAGRWKAIGDKIKTKKILAEESTTIVPIWFNPWQHQGAERPVVALLQEVREQYTYLRKFTEKLKKLSSVAIEAGLPILGELGDAFSALQGGGKTGLGAAIGRIRGVGESYEGRNFEARHEAQRLQLLFEQAVDRLLRDGKTNETAKGSRMVIFIDDLDRCEAAQTVHLLEAIKLYLQTKNCVFVIGMDSAATRRAVRTVLGQDEETAREYLEKLFQTTFVVPTPRKREVFIKRLLAHHELEPNEDLISNICNLTEPNPRKLKSFLAGFATGWKLHGGADADQRIFLLIQYLRSYHPDVFRLLSYDPDQVAVLNEVLLTLVNMKPGSSPEAYFFRDAFIHVAQEAFGKEEEPERGAIQEIVDRVKRRLDRHKGDRRFVKLWQKALEDVEVKEEAVIAVFRPFLESLEASA